MSSADITFKRRWVGDTEVLPIEWTFNGRRLAVVDPEDRDQVVNFIRIYCEEFGEEYEPNGRHRRATEAMQEALSKVANPKPPMPDEPTGLGAVVEDGNKKRFIRAGDGWLPETILGQFRNPVEWSGIDAVRVLSEGVPA